MTCNIIPEAKINPITENITINIFEGCKNSQVQGNIGLGCAIAWFTSNKYTVSLPLNDCQFYDIIIEKDGKLETVQIKTIRNKNHMGAYTPDLRKIKRKSKKTIRAKIEYGNECDWLFILIGDGRKFLIPKHMITCGKSVSVGGIINTESNRKRKYASCEIK